MIYTIGTSNRSHAEFLSELRRRSITAVVDVRSSPFSRLPWFNRTQLERWAGQASLFYRYEGVVLGGRSEHQIGDPAYRDALDRIIAASFREHVAIFCAEGDPAQCHRSFAVSAALLVNYGLIARHIRRDGTCEDATDTLRRTAPQHIPAVLKASISEVLLAGDIGFWNGQNPVKKFD